MEDRKPSNSSSSAFLLNASLDSGMGIPLSLPPLAPPQPPPTMAQQTSTPIRPRPILASAFSLDSGCYEVSPVKNYSFQYGESLPLSTNVNVQDDIEGVDDELIFIDHHFSPIMAPNNENINKHDLVAQQQTNHENNQRRRQFNLAIQRRENRNNNFITNQNLALGDLNNNHVDCPNAYDLFALDDMEDDVFYDDQQDQSDGSDPALSSATSEQQQHWHHRPSCTMAMFDDMDQEIDDQVQTNRIFSASLTSTSSSSRCSSTPIPIPGAHNRRPSFFEDDLDGGSLQDEDMIDGNNYSLPIEYSLPDGRRMPYYHRMAPRLNRTVPNSLLNDSEVNNQEDSGLQMTTNGRANRPTFGSRFQISFSMIMRNREQQRYSPPPPSYNNRHHQWMPGCSNFLFRFGRLSLVGGSGTTLNQIDSLYNEARLLTPHPEMNEEDEENKIDLDINDFDDKLQQQQRQSPGLLFPMSHGAQENTVNFNQAEQRDFGTGNARHEMMMNVDVVPQMDRPNSHHHRGLCSNDPFETTLFSHCPFYQCQCSCQCGCECCGSNINSNNCRMFSTPLPDVVMVANSNKTNFNLSSTNDNLNTKFNSNCLRHLQQQRQRRNVGKHRNTLPSLHEVPYHSNKNENANQNQFQAGVNGGGQARRTMSVSLPIDQETISTVARGLRQISDDFRKLQIQKSIQCQTTKRTNAVAAVFPTTNENMASNPNVNDTAPTGLIRSMLGLFIITANANHHRNQQQSSNWLPSARMVDNSIFYTAPPRANNIDQSSTDLDGHSV